MKIKINSQMVPYCIYFVLFEVATIIPSHRSVIYLILVLFNAAAILTNRKRLGLALMSSFLIGNEFISIINVMMVLMFTKGRFRIKINKVNPLIIISIIVIGVNSFICSIIYGTMINAFFSIFYIIVLIFIIYSSKEIISQDELIYICKKFVFIEFIVSLTIILITRNIIPGDIHYGTLLNAHLFGMWLIIILLLLYSYEINILQKTIWKAFKKNLVVTSLIIIMLYLADAKVLLGALGVTLLCLPMWSKISNYSYGIFIFIITLFAALYIFISLLYTSPVETFIFNHSLNLARYIYLNEWNYKFNYIRGTLFNELVGIRFFIGFGLGQYGSRFANLFAYDSMARNVTTLNNFVSNNFAAHHIPNYIKYISFYDTNFVNQIQWRSAILSYPFSSLIAIIGELGVFGAIILGLILNKLFNRSYAKTVLIFFMIACFFDTYFDMFLCCGLVAIVLSNTNITY